MSTIGFVGLGNMGGPMARRLAEAGHIVRGYDTVADRVRPPVRPCGRPAEVAEGADVVILMLPDSSVVEHVLLDEGLLDAVDPATTIVDMSSSEPGRTRALAERAAGRGVTLVDAPVSGGVTGARAGTLTVMVGGPAETFAALRPVLGVLGSRVVHAGPLVGSGHAVKALNNLMSAAHLLVTSEALHAGRAFGLSPEVMLEIVNGSSGRSGSTENKWPNFVLTGSYDSGFGLRLMVKDMGIALGLQRATGTPARLSEAAFAAWSAAAEELPPDADHTEIAAWVEKHMEES